MKIFLKNWIFKIQKSTSLKNKIKQLGGSFLNHLTFIDHVFAGKDSILEEFEIEQGKSNLITVFSHYSKTGEIDLMDQNSLSQLSEITDCLIFCSNTNYPSLSLKTKNIRQKRNLGFDLAMHRDVLRKIKDSQIWPNLVLLTNNSVFWPSRYALQEQIEMCYEKMQSENKTIVFLTDSHQPKHHLQSYFILFDASHILTREKVMSSFESIRNWRWKRTTVYRGEKSAISQFLNFTNLLIMYPVESLIQTHDSSDYVSSRKSHLNPYVHLESELVKSGAKFRKKSNYSKAAGSVFLGAHTDD